MRCINAIYILWDCIQDKLFKCPCIIRILSFSVGEGRDNNDPNFLRCLQLSRKEVFLLQVFIHYAETMAIEEEQTVLLLSALQRWWFLCLYLYVRVWCRSELWGHQPGMAFSVQGQGCQLAMDVFLQTTNPIFVNKSRDDTLSHHLFWGHICYFPLSSQNFLV